MFAKKEASWLGGVLCSIIGGLDSSMENAPGWGRPLKIAHLKARRPGLSPHQSLEINCPTSTGSMTLASPHQHRATLGNTAIPRPSDTTVQLGQWLSPSGRTGCPKHPGMPCSPASPSFNSKPNNNFQKANQVCVSGGANRASTVTFL